MAGFYDPATGAWSKTRSNAVPVVVTVGDDPASFVIAHNGNFWAFMAADTQLVAIKSSDQGQTWGATIVILVSFALIIVSTTVSTGPFVQVLGKALYYVIVLGVVVSLATWIFRGRLEKRLQDR